MTVAVPPQLDSLLSTLTTSLTSTKNSLPASLPSSTAGISLLDLKNDVFLSYLHHLSYLLLFRIRNGSLKSQDSDTGTDGANGDELVKKLAELRVWLEKGVKPCENKLKYQVEKVLKAAGEFEREEARKAAQGSDEEDEDEEEDGEDEDLDEGDEEGEEEDSDEEITSEEDEDLPKTVNYDSDDLSSKPKSKGPAAITMKNALAYRPNPTALAKPSTSSLSTAKDGANKDGIYRPPKLNPVSMPMEPTTTTTDRTEKREKKQKSRVLDEYLAESSTTPMAQPSIGSNVSRKGRTATHRERAEEKERRDYEESNFVRLPKLSKKEQKAKNKREGGGAGRREWGGEDWSSLGNSMGLDRIERLTKRRSDDGGKGALGRSRKRGGEEFGGDAGAGIGERWEKRRKVVDRDRRKKSKP